MGINLIAMLTNHDMTVPGAKSVFEENRSAKTGCWGFKDVGIELSDAKALVASMKAEGKTTFMEPLIESEEGCLEAAQFAIDCGFEYVIGMEFYESVAQKLKGTGIQYFPTCGRRAGIPRMLYGTVQEIIDDAKGLLAKGVSGIDLLAFRHQDGAGLARAYCQQIDKPVVIAGSINSPARIDFINEINPWAFTMGSALFTENFAKGEGFRKNLQVVVDYMNSIH